MATTTKFSCTVHHVASESSLYTQKLKNKTQTQNVLRQHSFLKGLYFDIEEERLVTQHGSDVSHFCSTFTLYFRRNTGLVFLEALM